MSQPEKRRALGRGLDALLPDSGARPGKGRENVFTCPIERIVPQKGQPRQMFDELKIEELTASIREFGVLEPVVVRRSPGAEETYELIAGERRWRAAQRAGLLELLVVVKDVSTADAFELALLENVQREDLNAIELAEAFDRLIREHDYTQEALAQRLGKDRTTIANSLRLLKLPPRVRTMVIGGNLSEGHARALLGAADSKGIEALAEKVSRGQLSVRDTEKLVRQSREAKIGDKPKKPSKSASIRDLEGKLMRHLGTQVEVVDRGGKGELVVKYGSLDDLDRILDKILS